MPPLDPIRFPEYAGPLDDFIVLRVPNKTNSVIMSGPPNHKTNTSFFYDFFKIL